MWWRRPAPKEPGPWRAFFQSVALDEISGGTVTLVQWWRMKVREGKRIEKRPPEKTAEWWGATTSIALPGARRISRSDLFSCPNISFTTTYFPASIQTAALFCLSSCFPSSDPHHCGQDLMESPFAWSLASEKNSRPYRRMLYFWGAVQGASSTTLLCSYAAKQ